MNKTTFWFDAKSRTLYIVSDEESRERMADIRRSARFSGESVHTVSKAWVDYVRQHDPFAKEINLEVGIAKPGDLLRGSLPAGRIRHNLPISGGRMTHLTEATKRLCR